jgi:light-regulated signal transduction histidine kinase (bacteriophytochrome)
VGIVHDITARKQVEAEREALFAELKASNEERGHFAHVASHDLQQPLRMICSFGALLHERYGAALDEQGREYLSLVTGAAQRMHTLIEDLLEYGRLVRAPARDLWFEADACLKQVRDNLSEAIAASGAHITAGLLPSLYGNEIRFARLLQNLVANGLNYVATGTPPHVNISAGREGDLWRFDVSDNGIGIAGDDHDRIFEPFKRLHSAEAYQGTGLGLSICKKIVEEFGGQIWVRSAPGAGATFSFTIKNGPPQ